ncbi:nuclear pore complex protein NUP62-like [Haliotis rubra]|uniref:nuclear pore complex protein NUP62-like n=1 Tax=Haliotis rubra TaxID=36100 RepID=UPI001EE5C575|nr:nuclear pore complex protein NUP62-like [Haliotis rubra]XP_046554142.1 nuclear pore complex protein NUP62-like [Haliotis rubra]
MTWRPRDSLCVFIWLTLLVAEVPGYTVDGKNYIIACPRSQSTNTVKCTLLVQGSEGTSITINGSGTGYPKTETITDALEISIIIQDTSSSVFILTVTTTDVVSIFVQNEASGLITSSYLALAFDEDLNAPYTGAGMENAFVSFPVSSPEKNLYVVGSAYAGTVVTIALVSTGPVAVQSVTYNSGDTISVSVDALQGIEITTGEDLSGSLLTSDKPVGVFSGTIIGETLEQTPTMSKWAMPTPVVNMDICNSFKILAVASGAGSLQINENDFVVNVDLLKAGAYQHLPNKTSMVQTPSSLVGMQCRIGVNNKPLFLTMATFSQLGTEFKCYTFSGFVNTMYIIAFKDVPISYDINGESFNFTVVDTYSASTVSTYRGSVPDGFFVMKAYDTFPFLPYVVGVTSDGSRTYAHACAKGSLGSLLPEPTTSLSVDVTSTLDPGSESVLMTSSSIETSADVTLSSSMDITPSTTLQDSSSQSMEYSTSLASSLMDLVSSSGMPSDAVSSSTPVISSSSATADASFVSTAQVADSTASPSLSTTAAPSTDVATYSSPLATSTSSIDVTSSAIASTGNDAIYSSIPASTSSNAIYSSIPASTSSNAIYSSIPASTSSNAVTSSVVSASPTGSTITSSVSATPVQTTALATVTENSTGGLQEVCLCRCGERVILPNETQQFLEQYDIDIKINLTLDAKTLSAYIRAKTSADDERPSAQNFGYLGICMLTITFGFLILLDILNMCQFVLSKKK